MISESPFLLTFTIGWLIGQGVVVILITILLWRNRKR